MIGAIIGDIIGSRHEGKGTKSKQFRLFTNKNRPTDDTVMTLAVALAIMAQIAKQITFVQKAIEEVRRGQENDRLASAYSCQQKLIQAMAIGNSQLKANALLQLASSAEDSRNLLMLSQKENIRFIKDQPEETIRKLLKGASPDKIEERMNEIREGLNAINAVKCRAFGDVCAGTLC